jgi:hypothetical protein
VTAEATPASITAPIAAALESVQPLVSMSRDELVVIALESPLAAATADYLSLADAEPEADGNAEADLEQH